MKPEEYWKNFNLGEELSISGAFIYDGMRRFHEMKNLDHPDEMFRFLYDLSVGLERLLKVAVVLFEHERSSCQDSLEKSLITHNHLELLNRIRNHTDVSLAVPHHDLLSLLSRFYKSLRYDRFLLSSIYKADVEKKEICDFLRKNLGVSIVTSDSIFGVCNESRYKKYIRKITLKISSIMYEAISSKARSLNIHTYELRHGSKAESIFLRKVDISDEDVLWKELLVFFMNSNSTSEYLDFIRRIKPLDFDPALITDYLDCFQSDSAKSQVMDELEHYYEELDDKKARIDVMKIIGASGLFFDMGEDDSEE